MTQIHLTIGDINLLATKTAKAILGAYNEEVRGASPVGKKTVHVYAIPRGGVPAAYAVLAAWGRLSLSPYAPELALVDTPEQADLAIDDLIDTGATAERHRGTYDIPTFALIDKRSDPDYHSKWVVFPWEVTAETGIEDHIVRLLQYVGEDATRGGLLETPKRVAKAWKHWCGGYEKDPAALLKVFEDGAENCDEMVLVKDIPIYSHCEHHLAPIFGTVTIAYIPNGKIVGLSKLSRLADAFARRLQVQERLTNQIADAIEKHLDAKAVGVIVKARHLCMESRGICQQGHHTVTSALRGRFIESSAEGRAARAEFMQLAG